MFGWLFKGAKPALRGASAPGASPGAAGTGEAGAAVAAQKAGLGLQHHRAGRLAEAEALYREALALAPQHIDALHFLGVIAYQREDPERAAQLISQALSLNAANAPAHNNLGNALKAQGRLAEAAASYRRALALSPDYVDAQVNLGVVLRLQGQLDEAIACYRQAIALAPEAPAAYSGLGTSLVELGKPEEALACYRKALELAPDSPEIRSNLGNVLREQGRLEEAIACHREALALNPDFSEAHSNLGNDLRDQGNLDEAIACYRKAIALKPDFPEAHSNLGNALLDQGRDDEAIACHEKALTLNPGFANALSGLANALQSKGRVDEAIASYRRALVSAPDFAEAHYNLGKTLAEQDRSDEAVVCYRKALELNPEYAEARWSLALAGIPAVCATDDDPGRDRLRLSGELVELDHWFDAPRVARGFNAVGIQTPFYLAYREQDNRELLRRHGALCCRIMSEWFRSQGLLSPKARRSSGPVRVGIVSRHFYNHSVWNAIVKGWFRQLDRERFTLYGFYPGFQEDEETLLARSFAAHFEQGGRGLRQWVEAILGRQLDVLIYPEIGMDPMTVRLASLRLAPVQVATWGHPETTGLPSIDYFLSAEGLEPDQAQDNYTEQLVKLPGLGCFYESPRIRPASPGLESLGIDPRVPLLVCPGVPFKYAPEHDRVFTEIARRLGRCRFIFFTHKTRGMSDRLQQRLEKAFARSRLDAGKFVTFIPWQNWPEFYGLMERADVFLDTIGFSGFNTAMQAVECGLPIVTRDGRFLRGRLASGILRRMGLDELVVRSDDDYVALAAKLVEDGAYRENVSRHIATSRLPLFQDLAPIRGLEEFLAQTGGQN